MPGEAVTRASLAEMLGNTGMASASGETSEVLREGGRGTAEVSIRRYLDNGVLPYAKRCELTGEAAKAFARTLRSATDADAFGNGGGAFPEFHVAQFPLAMGRTCKDKAAIADAMLRTGMTFQQIQCEAGRAALRGNIGGMRATTTEEWENAKAFLQKHGGDVMGGLITLGRGAVPQIPRISKLEPLEALEQCLSRGTEGSPVVVADAFHDWPAFSSEGDYTPLTFDHLVQIRNSDAAEHTRDSHPTGSSAGVPPVSAERLIPANDRAPARHRDADVDQRPQTIALVGLDDFVSYVKDRDGEEAVAAAEANARQAARNLSPALTRTSPEATVVPAPQSSPAFYLNGWKAFSECAILRALCPSPYFSLEVDHNHAIMSEVAKAISVKAGPGTVRDTFTNWAETAEVALTKIFLGPRHTITRLHFDAGGAHAWLGQLVGRKWLILFPPSDAQHLSILKGEVETVQSAVDPLLESLRAEEAMASAESGDWREWLRNHPPKDKSLDSLAYHMHARPVQTVLHPGEAILTPKGWWHYAISLDPSITVMRNFYESHTNVKDCIAMVREQLVSAVRKASARARGVNMAGT